MAFHVVIIAIHTPCRERERENKEIMIININNEGS